MDAKTTPDAYGTLIEPTTLRIQRLLPGPIERIWAYLTDSELRRKWLAAGAMEMKVGAPVECVRLLHGQPRHPPALSGQRVTGAGQRLLLHEHLLARGFPLLCRNDVGLHG